MNELVKVFECEEFGRVRTVVRDNEVWFVGKDIGEALGYARPNDAISAHCKGSVKHRIGVTTGTKADGSPTFQEIEMKIIPERDVYRLIMRSKLPNAEKFEEWVVGEVLPSIRKNGGYIVEKEDDTDDDILARALVIAQDKIKKREERIKALENRVEVDKPKVEYYEKVIDSESTFTTTQIAKELFMSAKQLNLILSNMGVQFKQSKQWMLYNKYQDKGYMKTRTTPYVDSQGIQQTNHISVWTEKGREFIHDLVEDL